MKTLKLNVKKLRKKYLEKQLWLPERFVELFILRTALLCANPLFVEEWQGLNKLYNNLRECDSKHQDVPKSEEYRTQKDKYWAQKQSFLDRWSISHPDGLHDIRFLPSLYVRLLDSHISEGKLSIEIDLNGSKGRILSEVTALVSDWHKEFKDRLEWHWNLRFEKDSFNKKAKNFRLDGNIKNKYTFDDYYTYLHIFLYKNTGNSWAKTVSHFGLQNIETARNHYNSANRLIKNGLPSFPPFPQK